MRAKITFDFHLYFVDNRPHLISISDVCDDVIQLTWRCSKQAVATLVVMGPYVTSLSVVDFMCAALDGPLRLYASTFKPLAASASRCRAGAPRFLHDYWTVPGNDSHVDRSAPHAFHCESLEQKLFRIHIAAVVKRTITLKDN